MMVVTGVPHVKFSAGKEQGYHIDTPDGVVYSNGHNLNVLAKLMTVQ
jgi:hypothetical protein